MSLTNRFFAAMTCVVQEKNIPTTRHLSEGGR
jgi:hypothetical protein